jgi:hypothetical protein
MKITTCNAHGTDAIHCHVAILRPKNNGLQGSSFFTLGQLPPFEITVFQIYFFDF